MADSTVDTSGPIEARLTSSAWKARQSAFEDIEKSFKYKDGDDPVFEQYAGSFKAGVDDKNEMVIGAALSALCAFIDQSPALAARMSGDLCPSLVKCLSKRAGAMASKALLLLIEVENANAFQEAVLAGFSAKSPKDATAALDTMLQALKEFGLKKFTVKEVIKATKPLFEHSNKDIRGGAQALVVEMAAWGLSITSIKAAVPDMKDIVITQIEAECAKNTEPRAPTRYLRSETPPAPSAAGAAPSGTGAGAAVAGSAAARPAVDDAIDPYTLLDPVNVLRAVQEAWFTELFEAKWSTRKEAAEKFLKAVSSPRLAPGDYGDMVAAMTKVINEDANIMVAVLALQVMEKLAIGLRGDFASYARNLFAPVVARFKDNKPALTAAVNATLDAMSPVVRLADVMEAVTAGANDKTPAGRKGTMLFVKRFVATNSAADTRSGCKALMPLVLGEGKGISMNDKDNAVREAATEALTQLYAVVGDKMLGATLDGLDAKKSAKIRADAAALGGGAAAAPEPTAAAAAAAPASKKAAAVVVDDETPATSTESAPPVRKVAAKRPATAGAKKPAAAAPAPSTPVAAARPAPSTPAGDAPAGARRPTGPIEPMAPAMTPEDCEARYSEFFSEALVAQLTNSAFKERIAGMAALTTQVEEAMPSIGNNGEIYLRFVIKHPGFKDANINVKQAVVTLIGKMADGVASFSRHMAALVVEGLVAQFGDAKLKTLVTETLLKLAEATSPAHVIMLVSRAAGKQTAPKAIEAAVLWIQQALEEFGVRGNKPKDIIEFLGATPLASNNAAVRGAAYKVLGVLYKSLKDALENMLQEYTEPQKKAAKDEFAKIGDAAPAAPIRFDRRDVAPVAGNGKGKGAAAAGGAVDLDDLIPRSDISREFKDALLKELVEDKWQVRSEALGKIEKAVTAAGKRIQPTIDNVIGALKGRLADKNKNLAAKTANLLGFLITAMGEGGDKYTRIIIPSVCAQAGDSDKKVCKAAIDCLETWVGVTKRLDTIIPCIGNALSEEGVSSSMRELLLTWLGTHVEELNGKDMSSMSQPIIVSLTDKSAAVRNGATALMEAAVRSVTFRGMERALKSLNLKPATNDQVMATLNKFRNVTAAPASAAASVADVGAATSTADAEEAPEAGPSRPRTAAPGAKKSAGKSSIKEKAGTPSKKASLKEKPAPAAKAAAKRPATAGARPATAAAAPEPASSSDGTALISNQGKEARNKKNKTVQWTAVEPVRPDLLEILREQAGQCFSGDLQSQMFATDFKGHIAALATLKEYIAEPQFDVLMECIDVVFKWISARLHDTNPVVFTKCIEFLASLFGAMDAKAARVSEYEASIIVPVLLVKIGSNRDEQRKAVRDLLPVLCQLFPSSKLAGYVCDALKSKNARTRTECLDELGRLIGRYGFSTCPASKVVPLLGKQIADADNKVRDAAINAVIAAYHIDQTIISKQLKDLPEASMALLQGRIKRSGPAPASAAGPAPSTPSKGASSAAANESRNETLTTTVVAAEETLSTSLPSASFNATAVVDNSSFLDDARDQSVTLSDPTAVIARLNEVAPVERVRSPAEEIIALVRGGDQGSLARALETLRDAAGRGGESLARNLDEVASGLVLRMHLIVTADPRSTALCQLARDCLLTLFLIRAVARLRRETVEQIYDELLLRMVDPRLKQESMEDKLIQKCLNAVMVAAMSSIDRTTTFSYLIRRLDRSLTERTVALMDIQMKCLVRIIKELKADAVVGPAPSLNVDEVLKRVHEFLTNHPVDSFPVDDNLPLRAIKTLVVNLVNLLGKDFRLHLQLLPSRSSNAATMQIASYADSYFNQQADATNLTVAAGDSTNVTVGAVAASENTPSKRSTIPAPSGLGAATPRRDVLTASTAANTPAGGVRASTTSIPTPGKPTTATAQAFAERLARIRGAPVDQENVAVENNRAAEKVAAPVTPVAVQPTAEAAAPMTPAALKRQLGDIFKKISTNETGVSKEGIRDLYAFKKAHPEMDIDPFFSQCSQVFQTYINNSLAQVAAEQDQGPREAETTRAADASEHYLGRLAKLREKFGLQPIAGDSNAAATGAKLDAVAAAAGAENVAPVETEERAGSTSLNQLRERLARIKNGNA